MSAAETAQDNSENYAEVARPTGSLRDTDELGRELQDWLTGKLPDGANPVVSDVRLPGANGMSSETILFDATWTSPVTPLASTTEPAEDPLVDSTAPSGRSAGSAPASGRSAGSAPASGRSAGSAPASGRSAGSAPASGRSAGSAPATRRTHELVARVEPGASSMPIFPSYEMGTQFAVMKAVGELSDVPVPAVYWSEPDPGPLGAPFFVMQRIEGQVPPDVMPYNFGSWMTEATDEQRRTLQDASVDILAKLHSIADPQDHFGFLRLHDAGPTAEAAFRAHLARQRGYYEWATESGPRSPLIERCLDWLEANVPADDSPAVLCWGDARIGNIMYRDFEPVAALDWEMAALGTREMDLAWMIFLHRFFEDLTTMAGLPGLPDFMRRDDMAARYEELAGHRSQHLDFYSLYAALRHATIMFRIQSRAIAFGQAEQPADPDDMILHRKTLEAMLDGTYWERVS